MLDAKALRLKMFKQSCSVAELAKVIGISKTALYRRLNGEVEFTVPEMLDCSKYLNLFDTERDEIFFAEKVAKRLQNEEHYEKH